MLGRFSKKLITPVTVLALLTPPRESKAVDHATCEAVSGIPPQLVLAGFFALAVAFNIIFEPDPDKEEREEWRRIGHYLDIVGNLDHEVSWYLKDDESVKKRRRILSERLRALGYSSDLAGRLAIEHPYTAREVIGWESGPIRTYLGFPQGADPRDWRNWREPFRDREDLAREDLGDRGLIMVEAEVPAHFVKKSQKRKQDNSRLLFKEDRLQELPRFATRTIFLD